MTALHYWKTTTRLLLLLLCGGLLACESETVEPERLSTIEGTVRDSRTNLPIPTVVITTNPATTSITTDAAGHFSFENVPIGKYALTIRKTDYKQETVNISLSESEVTRLTVMLEKSVGNSAPSRPSQPLPAHQATGIGTDFRLRWRATDPDPGDSLRYDVVLYESNSPVRSQLMTNGRDTSVAVTNLKYSTTYFWQVTVKDKAGQTTSGDIWAFQTEALPDNRYLYVRNTAGNYDIFSSNAAGTSLLRLTTSPFLETAPQLSPMRDKVAYTSNATGQYHLYTMNRDGSDQRRISTVSVDGYFNEGLGYHWSPDGSQLIYAHYDQLYRINRDGSGLALIATAPVGRHFRECDWTTQGNRIVVQTIGSSIYESELYLMNSDGSNRTVLVSNQPGRIDSPTFSIDGRTVMYTRDVAGFEDATGRQLNAHIFVQRLDGTGLVDVSAGSGSGGGGKPAGTNDLNPRFSPDGAKIIFTNVANDNQSPPEIWTMDLDGRNRTRLFQNASLPDWR